MEFNNILDFINKDEFRNWSIIEDYQNNQSTLIEIMCNMNKETIKIILIAVLFSFIGVFEQSSLTVVLPKLSSVLNDIKRNYYQLLDKSLIQFLHYQIKQLY